MDVPREVIEGLVREHGSVNAAARAIGMPEGTLHRLYRGDRDNPTLDTLRKLAEGAGVSLGELADSLEEGKGNGARH